MIIAGWIVRSCFRHLIKEFTEPCLCQQDELADFLSFGKFLVAHVFCQIQILHGRNFSADGLKFIAPDEKFYLKVRSGGGMMTATGL